MSGFSWENFDGAFINTIVYNDKTRSDLIPKKKNANKDFLIPTMEMIAPYPTSEFIKTYREEIEYLLLKNYPDLIGKIYKDVVGGEMKNHLTMLNKISTMKLGNILMSRYISALSEIGSLGSICYQGISLYRKPVTIDLKTSHINEITLYDFQKVAIKNLKENLITSDNASGLLVMPTGSGKTRTAVYFLLEELVSKGYQVIWLTHRHMLIEQTASVFHFLSPLVKNNNLKKQLKMTCVSGEHSSIRATEKGDDILIISVQSGFRGLDYISSILSKKVIIVVDEAHHTVAMSYRRIIDLIRKKRNDAKLLGLTATPVRGTDDESKYLLQLYENNFIYSIPMSELIKRKTLADPIFERIETNVNFEPIITVEESDLIRKYGELPAQLASKIAESSKRNQVIIETYMKDPKRYGKTLIFALNKIHCITLNEEFRKRNIKSDYVYSGDSNNGEVIRKFKDNELDVLININILTEGSDVPDIQSVFLTRPTQSEGLLMQMIGRGLRGINAKGTEEAIIVDFCDKWDTFNKWLNPAWLINKEKVDLPPEPKKGVPPELISIPFDAIYEIYNNIEFTGETEIIKSVGLPFGWYNISDKDDEDYTMLVWREQLPGLIKLIIDKQEVIKNHYSAKYVIAKYFNNFVMPPSIKDLEILLYNLKNLEQTPRLFKFESRDIIDPTNVVKRLKAKTTTIDDLRSSLEEIYKRDEYLINNIYGDFKNYYDMVSSKYVKYENEDSPMSHIEEIEEELLPYKIEPTHDLEVLMAEVIDEMFDGSYEGINSIAWTDKIYTSFYARYTRDGNIQFNKILNSPQVDKEVIKFVIYHELLHRDYWDHDKNFYREEHKYPNYTEHNRFLDYKLGKFNLEM